VSRSHGRGFANPFPVWIHSLASGLRPLHQFLEFSAPVFISHRIHQLKPLAGQTWYCARVVFHRCSRFFLSRDPICSSRTLAPVHPVVKGFFFPCSSPCHCFLQSSCLGHEWCSSKLISRLCVDSCRREPVLFLSYRTKKIEFFLVLFALAQWFLKHAHKMTSEMYVRI
jgi:hypothetical protein